MIHQIFFFVLILSFSILVFLFFRKAPQLMKFEEEISAKKDNIFLRIRKRVANISFVKEFSWNNILQKLLSKIRVMILKIETKIGDQLHFLRKSSEKKK